MMLVISDLSVHPRGQRLCHGTVRAACPLQVHDGAAECETGDMVWGSEKRAEMETQIWE